MEKNKFNPQWAAILNQALENPSALAEAANRFSKYSVKNKLLLFSQMLGRGVPIQDVATYKAWQEMGRQVIKGAKGLWLCVPGTIKVKEAEKKNAAEGWQEVSPVRRYFFYRKSWFLVADTEGQEILPVPEQRVPFDPFCACRELGVQFVTFDLKKHALAHGYAIGRKIAIHPNSHDKEGTFFHELAHVVLGHTVKEVCIDGENLSHETKEIEAEGVAYLCKVLAGLGWLEESKLYLQDYLKGNQLPEKSAERIFSAAEKILTAGEPKPQGLDNRPLLTA